MTKDYITEEEKDAIIDSIVSDIDSEDVGDDGDLFIMINPPYPPYGGFRANDAAYKLTRDDESYFHINCSNAFSVWTTHWGQAQYDIGWVGVYVDTPIKITKRDDPSFISRIENVLFMKDL